MYRKILSRIKSDPPLPQTKFDPFATINDVVSAYRLCLGRNPDEAGFKHYQQLIQHGLPVETLYQNILDSDEYRQKREREESTIMVDCGGYNVCVRRSEKDFGNSIAANQTWEPHVVEVLSELLSPGQTFVDVGANVGVMSFLGAKIVGAAGKVIAVEPNPDNLQLLYAGIVQNRFSQVHVLPFAASNKRAVFSLDGGTSNTYLTEAKVGKEYTQSVMLDEVLNYLEQIDVVKMDIEGHEPYALEGFKRLLKKHQPHVLVEFNPRCLTDVAQFSPSAFLDMFFDLFTDVEVLEHSGKRTKFDAPNTLWVYWKEQNNISVQKGLLPDGLLHYDLLAKTRG